MQMVILEDSQKTIIFLIDKRSVLRLQHLLTAIPVPSFLRGTYVIGVAWPVST